MSHRLSDYDYELPPGLVATRPADRRDASRMLVLVRGSGRVTHAGVADLPAFLRPGDLAILNNSKVIRARLVDGRAEIFLLERREPLVWIAMVRPGRKFRAGARASFLGHEIEVAEAREDGTRVIRFDREPDLEKAGRMPIPPYFRREPEPIDDERYQTVFAAEPGSVAAPTAGLHFTPELLAAVPHAFVTLHVGAGTFLPVKTEDVAGHVMHEETYSLGADTAAAANRASRILAVGTTVARVLESQPAGPLRAASGRTAIFIRPPHEFRHVGALLTNFHLPRSTLLMLVSAFAGREAVLAAYREAVERHYRFFSYGDCMLIV